MNFDELNSMIPHAYGGKEKVLQMKPYPNITLAMPGRHQNQTASMGGDFVVMVDDPIYRPLHQFTHTDIFTDIEKKSQDSHLMTEILMDFYFHIIMGGDVVPLVDTVIPVGIESGLWENMIDPETFLQACQCLAVAEHRRYAQYEQKFGGRYLPFRFAAGIAEGLWTAAEAADLQKKGRPGVEQLERTKGTPQLTKELMF